MKKSKDVHATIAQLRAFVARSDVGPDQKKHVGVALDELRRLHRKPKFTQEQVFYCVRRVAESLLNAFRKG
jgi:hypothetical protein